MNNSYFLDQENNSKLKTKTKTKTKLGVILREADLVSSSQIKTALEYQKNNSFLRLGEILSIQGITKPRTCDFFALEWHKYIELEYRKPLGYYLVRAGLLKKSELKSILSEQQQEQSRYRFGTIAVTEGFIKSSTIDFFLKYLFPEEWGTSPMRSLDSLVRSRQRQYKYYLAAIKKQQEIT